ncbi:phosphatidylinositol-binding protein scs2 [Varicellaria rhodocarpa]|nr:phosphatidylinositol-binding protein scs2 [Varicellaria rhodocarpa]
MSVELDPPELGFRRPFTQEVTQVLRLRNPNNDPVAFKVKTTAPKQYCVRPNSGRIDPGGTIEVQVLLQAMKEDPPLDARCRDKFLVQSVAISKEQDLPNVSTVWQNIEKAARSSIEERKIRVSFLQNEMSHNTPQHNDVNGTHTLHDASPPSYRSPSPVFGSPAPTGNTHEKSEGLYSDDLKSLHQDSTIMGTASSSITNAASTANAELQKQLDAAKSTITTLQQKAEEQGLRQRKSDTVNQDSKERITTGTTGMGIQQQPADGVPVQIVAALCLLSFLLAYFFF